MVFVQPLSLGLIPAGCAVLAISPAGTGRALSWDFTAATRIPLLLLGGFKEKESRQQSVGVREHLSPKKSPCPALSAML